MDENIGVRELVGRGPLGKKDPDETPRVLFTAVPPAKINMKEFDRPIVVTKPLGKQNAVSGQVRLEVEGGAARRAGKFPPQFE